MEATPLISIIVPVYNVELYLHKCIDSILRQTYTHFELILIDDGSTDKCGEICDEYSKRDSRIKVIHKENGGLSDARNAGLDQMKGDLVTCIDSDDFVSSYYLDNLFLAMKIGGTEISASWFKNYDEGDELPSEKKIDENQISVISKTEYYKHLLYQNKAEVSAWGKLYKTHLFNNVRYPKGKIYEDMATIYRLVDQVNSIAVISSIDYYYLQRNNSIVQARFSTRKMDAITHVTDFVVYIDNTYPELHKAAICRYFSVLCNILFMIKDEEYEAQRQYLWSEIKKHRFTVLSDINARKKARYAAMLSYGGYHFMKAIFSILR